MQVHTSRDFESELCELRHPVACDLRLLTGIAHLATDLERIGDETVNIAERADVDDAQAKRTVESDLRTMAGITQEMLRGALEAFAASDDNQADAIFIARAEDVRHRHGVRSSPTALERENSR